MSKVYSDDSIKTLDIMTAIRLRPAMYIDGIGELGLFKMDSEAVQNIFDEALIGEANECIITYDTKNNIMTVRDNGRGIPINKIEDVFTKAHTGGKFDRESYEISSGMNGIGVKAINALSSFCKVEVYRQTYNLPDGTKVPAQHALVTFEKGRKIDSFIEDLPDDSMIRGTKITYSSDDTILKTNNRNIDKFLDYLNINSYLIPNLYIEMTIDGIKHVFKHSGGISELLTDFVKNKKIKTIIEPIQIVGVEQMFSFEIFLTYGATNSGDTHIVSAVNGNRTPAHGSHVSAFKTGCSMALTQFMNETDAVPSKYKNYNVSGALISDNIVGVVSVKHREPLYSGQTKEAFRSTEVIEPIKAAVRSTFLKWLHNNPQQAKKLINMAISYAEYEFKRKQLKKTLVETKITKSAFAANGISPGKYSICKETDPEKRELFIVEGDSASGELAVAQDKNFQSLYRLRGKLTNMVKGSKTDLDKTLTDLVQILGMGIPMSGKVNYNNLQYNKVILLTDADDDGAHIATLLLGFIYSFYPKIIEDGYVYIANPPIKKMILSNGSSFYIHTEKDYDRLMKEFILHSFDLHSEFTKKRLSKELFDVFIDACNGYDILLENHASSLALSPDLLERIVIYVDILTKCTNNINDKYNKEFLKKTGYTIRNQGHGMYTFDLGIYHASLRFDNIFYKEHFKIISERLHNIHIYGVYLRGKRSEKDYHGTIYQLCKYMQDILGPKIHVLRYKGLGEMNAADLMETSLDPTTRVLTKVTMDDAEKAEKAIRIFMTDENIKFKRLFYSGDIKFE